MTERLYYHDSALLKFDATIVHTEIDKDGLYITVLDRSAFYPTSGGQQFDTGQLNGIKILNVTEDADGGVRHYSEQPVGDVGLQVVGQIDSERRRRHCCLHTGQHIISHVSMQLYKMKTVSVHLGDEYGAVELEGNFPSSDELLSIETDANEIVRDSHPVKIVFAEGEKLAALPLRKPPKRTGEIRVVNIGNLEYSGCGGTHCANTSEIGILKIIGVEKLRGHVLIKFLIGKLAFEDYRARFDVTSELAKKFTCHYTVLPDRIKKLFEDQKALKQELVSLYKELLPIRAEELAQPVLANGKSFLCTESDLPDAKLASQLAQMIAEKIVGVVLLCQRDRLLLAVAESSSCDARKLVGELTSKFGLKGGGSKLLAQLGGADAGMLSEYESLITELLEE